MFNDPKTGLGFLFGFFMFLPNRHSTCPISTGTILLLRVFFVISIIVPDRNLE